MRNLTYIQYIFLCKWLVCFMLTSCLLTLLFCFENSRVLIFHVFLIPLYFMGFWVLTKVYLIGRKEFEFPLGVQLSWILIVIFMIGFFLVDFQSTFGLAGRMYNNKSNFFERLISSGCREMFYFLSLLLSSIIIVFYDYHYKILSKKHENF